MTLEKALFCRFIVQVFQETELLKWVADLARTDFWMSGLERTTFQQFLL